MATKKKHQSSVARRNAARARKQYDGVILRFSKPPHAELTITMPAADLIQHARDWNYRLRDRRRWATREAGVMELRRNAREFVGQMGIQPELIARAARERIVQVDLSDGDDEFSRALRGLPWEYLLATATRPLRSELDAFTVIRRLRASRPVRRAARPRHWLMVESAPGALHEQFDFTSERDVVERSAGAIGARFHLIKDPTPAALKKRLMSRPTFDVVHLAGFDVHQSIERLQENDPETRWDRILLADARDGGGQYEGYVLASATTTDACTVPAQELGRLICAGRPPPDLVTCNLYNSAYQIAQALVHAGAQAAIGFQDTFDDQLAEQFFATFFRAWPAAEWSPIGAFNYAWEQVRQRKLPLQGSGLVLWTVNRLEDAKLIDEDIIRKRTQDRERLSADNVRNLLQVNISPIEELNYSILHNNGPLFKEFVIKKRNPNLGEVADLKINVELHVGTDTYPFRTTASMSYSEQQCDLSRDARVSLASTLNRALRENVRTSLFVEVHWRDVALHRETYRVTLLSVDEWRDDDTNRKWLPSFVLPRDPVVPQIIDRAQKYLMALLDDSTAGFDGYQSVEDASEDHPSIACEAIDLQVRAIWSALIYDTPLAYINPPPTFTDSSQRLRTPSDVITGKRGTCIDLALLLASCLEYVEIYPAIVLLKTHAFPAYWRHSSYHETFGEARPVATQLSTGVREYDVSLMNARGQIYSWYFNRPDHYREIMGVIQAGKLVPLETVSLTARAGYSQALEEGYRNLGNRREFDSMLDIQLARSDERWRVTPLPILRIEA